MGGIAPAGPCGGVAGMPAGDGSSGPSGGLSSDDGAWAAMDGVVNAAAITASATRTQPANATRCTKTLRRM